MKPSKAQLRMLERFGQGGQLHENHFGSQHWYNWDNELVSKGINYRTVYKLLELGLIRDIDPNPFEHTFAISDKGQDCLEIENRKRSYAN